MNNKIECIIVCRQYSDFLAITLSLNKKHFDNVIIVTDKNDIKTQELCKIYYVKCVIYDGFNLNGSNFNFGGARRTGLLNCEFFQWIVFLDVDTILPDNFRELFNIDTANKNRFYGSYRRFIPKLQDYQDLISGNKKLEEFEKIEGSGVGFFQLLYINNNVTRYHGLHNLYKDSFNSENVDIEFLRLFCPFIENDGNLVRMNIELLHLGNHGENHAGMVGGGHSFFNK